MEPQRTIVAEGSLGAFEGLADDRVVHGHYRAHGEWSPALLSLVCERIRPRTVIDVGANIGLFSVPVAERTGARCLCFEPEPTNHRLLRANVARHGLQDRIETFEQAADEVPRRLRMTLSDDNAGDHHIAGLSGADAGGPEVEAVRLDAALLGRALTPPTLLKLDTQGFELRALRGAAGLLQAVTHCVVEYWPAGLRRAGGTAEALRLALLQAFPYSVLLTEEGPESEPRPTLELVARLEFIGEDDPGFFDLLLLRSPTF